MSEYGSRESGLLVCQLLIPMLPKPDSRFPTPDSRERGGVEWRDWPHTHESIIVSRLITEAHETHPRVA